MMDYKILKLDKKYGIPTYDAFLPIVLDTLSREDCDCRVEDIQEAIPKYYFKLPEKLHHYHIKAGKTVIADRIYFACVYLLKFNLIRKSYPATYIINKHGREFLKKYPSYEPRFDAFRPLIKAVYRKYHKSSKSKPKAKSTPMSFPSRISHEINSYNQGLRSRLLKAIFDKHDPYFFEHVVVDLLAKMGYKGKHGNAITTKKSGDDGIDGIINQDPLGTNTVYVQAKCYNPSHKVSSPEIQQFNGALLHQRANQGVFITTSSFTKGAEREADKAILVDGKRLTSLMLEYHVGVQVRHTYQILNLDKDYFDD